MEAKNRSALIVTTRTKLDLQKYNNEDYFIIGVEQGCMELIKQGVRIDMATGDFDHVDDQELSQIEKYATVVQQFNPEKDELDGQTALNYVEAEGFYPIDFIVNPSARYDMNLSVMTLMNDYENLTILNENTIIKKIAAGKTEIEFMKSDYVSFYSLVDGNEITLKNFKYEADHLEANIFSVDFLSNEFLENQNGIIECLQPVVMIISK